MADGRIWFNTKIDNSNVEKDLRDLQRKIEKAQAAIAKNQSAKLPLENQLKTLNAQIEESKQHLHSLQSDLEQAKLSMGPGASPEDYMRASEDVPKLEQAIKETEKSLSILQKEWDSVNTKVQKYNSAIEQANTDIERNKAKIAQLGNAASGAGTKLTSSMSKAGNTAQKMGKSFSFLQVLFYSLLSAGLREFKDFFSSALTANDEYTAQLAKLKGAWRTAFQPVYEFALPAVLAVLKAITSVAYMLTYVMAFFSGKSVDEYRASAEALYDEANAISGIGAAAKKAQKHLAGFDEINRLSSDSGSGGVEIAAPDFSSWEESGAAGGGKIAEFFQSIKDIFVDNSDELSELVANMLQLFDVLIDNIIKPFTAPFIKTAIGAAIDWIIGVFHGLSEFLLGAFSGDWERAFGGLSEVFSSSAEFWETILHGWQDSLGWLSGWLHGVFTRDWREVFGETLGSILNSFFLFCDDLLTLLEEGFSGFIDFICGIFKGDWEQAWDGLKQVLKGALNACISLINWVVRDACNTLNALFSALSFNVKLPGGNRFSIDIPKIQNVPQIPLLAKGAVLPANKPFLAMVGDQRNGTNIEAPLSTIEEAVANVLARQGSSMTEQQIVVLLQEILQAVLGIELDGETLSNAVHAYDRKKAVSLGG